MSAVRRPRTAAALALAAASFLLPQGVAVAGPSDVDTAFGTGGSTTVPVGGTGEVGGVCNGRTASS